MNLPGFRRVALALLVLAAVGLGVLGLQLSRTLRGEAAPEAIRAAALATLGRELRYADLDFSLIPPSVRVAAPEVVGPADASAPRFEAERLTLQLALLPLIAGAYVVESLVVEGATLRLELGTRESGLPADAGLGPSRRSAPVLAAGSGAAPLRRPWAVRHVELRDATVVLLDRTVAPALTWEARAVEASARFPAPGAPMVLEFGFELASGGRVEGRGRVGRDAESLDLRLQLGQVRVAPVAVYLRGRPRLAGALSGSVTVRGSAREPLLRGELFFAGAALQLGELAVTGDLGVEAMWGGTPLADVAASADAAVSANPARFVVDATAAELRFADVHTRPRGEPKRLVGHVVRRPAGSFSFVVDAFDAGSAER